MNRFLSSVLLGSSGRAVGSYRLAAAADSLKVVTRNGGTNSSWRQRHGKIPEKAPKVTVEDNRPIEEIFSSIDTSLTPRQRQHVDALKRSYKGATAPRSVYRDVPTREEIKEHNLDNNYSPKMAENAEALIDWALAHVPERSGRRASRKIKKRERRQEAMRLEHSTRKNQVFQAERRKRHLKDKHDRLAMRYKREARRLYGDGKVATAETPSEASSFWKQAFNVN